MGLLTGEPVTRLRATTTTDGHGNVNRAWGSAVATTINGCAFAPSASSEDNSNRALVEADAILYVPSGTDLVSTDRVTVRGTTYDVDGQPEDWRSPYTTRRPGIAVPLRVVDG